MPIWFAVFITVFAPIICLASVLMGSYLHYCQTRQANPVRNGLMDFMTFTPLGGGGEAKKPKEEEDKGFYS